MSSVFDSKGPRGEYGGKNEEDIVSHLIREFDGNPKRTNIECIDDECNRYKLIDAFAVRQTAEVLRRYLKLLQKQ